MSATETKPLLTIRGVKTYYGNIIALKGVDVDVQQGEIVTLIGANGAGKTTTLKAITGTLPACKVEGTISYLGKPLGGRQAHQLVQQKLAMVPEGRGIFARMTVLENLQMGAWLRRDAAAVKQEMGAIFANFPRLAERQHQLAGLLSGGEQQLLALNRALLSQPRLLILDEPSMGLAPLMVENVFRVIATLRQRGVALLLIEQNARLALEATDSAWVMDNGSIVERGASQALLADDRIAQIYLREIPA